MYIYTLVTSIYKNNTKIAMQSWKVVFLAYLSHFHRYPIVTQMNAMIVQQAQILSCTCTCIWSFIKHWWHLHESWLSYCMYIPVIILNVDSLLCSHILGSSGMLLPQTTAAKGANYSQVLQLSTNSCRRSFELNIADDKGRYSVFWLSQWTGSYFWMSLWQLL